MDLDRDMENDHPIRLNVIAAVDQSMGIGLNGVLPWNIKREFQYFLKMISTAKSGKRNAVIMGRKTWDTMEHVTQKPFKGVLNIVLSRSLSQHSINYADTLVLDSLESAIACLSQPSFRNIDQVWVVGGAQVYERALKSQNFHRLYLTRINRNYECDSFFPSFKEDDYVEVQDFDVLLGTQNENGVTFQIHVYEKKEGNVWL